MSNYTFCKISSIDLMLFFLLFVFLDFFSIRPQVVRQNIEARLIFSVLFYQDVMESHASFQIGPY